jgi:hypothetical protein
MNSLKKSFFVFIVAAFATTACFPAETDTEKNKQLTELFNQKITAIKQISEHLKQDMELLKQQIELINQKNPTLTFENNEIEIEIKKDKNPYLYEGPSLVNCGNYRVRIKITNHTPSTIATTEKLFNNVSNTSLKKITIKIGLILSPLLSGIAGSFVGVGTLGSISIAKFIIDNGIKYLGNDKDYQTKDSYKDYFKLSLILGGATATATLLYCLYNLYNECKGLSNEQIIQPNQSVSFITYISKSDFEKLEKGLLTPELDVKKLEKKAR